MHQKLTDDVLFRGFADFEIIFVIGKKDLQESLQKFDSQARDGYDTVQANTKRKRTICTWQWFNAIGDNL